MSAFPEIRGPEADPGLLLARWLDFYRAAAVRKVASLPEPEQRASRLPSGWSPLELLAHLYFMERRWLVWGFLGEDVADPWGDSGADGGDRWRVAEDVDVAELERRLQALGRRTSEVLTRHKVDEVAPPGPRFEAEPASLAQVALHVLQEYARHTGHLDVVVELAGGATGE